MAITPTAAQLSILELNVAMFGQAVGTTAMAAALPTFKDGNTYAQSLVTTSDAYKILSPEQAFTKVINNLSAGTGVTAAQVDALAKGMVPFVTAGLSVGAVINLLTVFLYQNAGKLTGDAAIWNNSGTQLVNKTAGAAYYTLDQNQAAASADAIANISYRTGTDATSVSFQLTTANETFIGGAGNDTFYAVAGAAVGQQDQTTLNSGDSMAGGENNDVMYVNMVGNYNGGAMIHGIETLRLGTAGNVAFDYNVNEGQPQVADVTRLVADQINAGETLNITNIIKTNSVLPTLAWENDSTTSNAGTFGATYRAAQVTGTTDNQTVELKNVNNGVLNIAGGIETITISGTTGTSRDTLANSGNFDAGTVGGVAIYSNPADLVSTGSLNKVVMTGAVELGKAANVITETTSPSFGLTNRAVATDVGIVAGSTASNLLSVEARVTEVDASAMTANANVKFTPRSDVATGGSMNVKFTGGKANDYVEFQLGNSTAAGGEGNDTFAYVNGQTNSSFGANDVITGGTGTDTVQLGLNGAGTYTLSVTEFHQVTGVDVLDLRAQTDNVAIYSGMVAAADAGTFIVRTDKIVQQSDTDSSNNQVATANNGLEKNSTHTVYLNQLNNNQAIQFIGGSGSDRLVLNNATFSSAANLDGGVKDQVVNGAASNYVNAQYDTLTVVDNAAVIDNQDLLNVKNFQGIIFAKPQTGATANELLILTDAFLQANTMASNVAYTDINDTIFQIGTAGAGAGAALTAGDTVTIDYTYLTNASAGRSIDVQSLTAAGVTVVWKQNGVTTAQPTWVTADAAFASVANSAADTANVVAFTGTVTGNNGTTNMTVYADTVTTNGATTVDTLAGNDTITTGTGAAAPVSNMNLAGNLGNDTFNWTAGNIGGGIVHTIDGGAGTDVLNVSTDIAGAATVLNTTGIETINFTAAQTAANIVTTAATAGIAVTANNTIALTLGAAQTFTGTGTAVQTVTGSAGADTISMTNTAAGNAIISTGGNDTISFNGSTGNAGTVTITGNAGVDTVTVTNSGANSSVTTAAGNDVITVSNTAANAITINAGAGADSINLTNSLGADTITYGGAGGASGSNVLGYDTITGFKGGTDIIKIGTAGALLTAVTITTSTTATLAADIQTAANGIGAAWSTAAGDSMLITINNFDGAGAATFLAINTAAGAVFDNTDYLIKMVGMTSSIVVGDIIV